jgi:hypothetical protein
MSGQLEKEYAIDVLADEAGGYFTPPTKEDMAYTDLLFDICDQFGIRYYSATPKERYFVEEVTRATWTVQQARKRGIEQPVCPAFTA